MTIANPIYDSVFKYLMEDSRVARVILSALLKTEVKEVQLRPHEYVNSQRDTLSMFRIDFGAKVVNPDGQEQMILVEVQKTWLETETLRFRQYLGVQYERKENILPNSKEGYAMPMVAIYILGHKVGDIEEPVLYVRHKAYDYNNQPVTKGLPNPFVDSLTHESIIVQIPWLRGQINNHLEKVLAVFDQTRMDDRHGSHYLRIDESLFAGDEDMQAVLHRLLMAAADADMRQDMNVEDEYYSVIEKRDTEIALNAKKIAEQRDQINEQRDQINEQQAQLAEKDQVIRHSVQALAKVGMDNAAIAATLHISEELVNQLK
ncbi:MAG: hypothetical protein IJ570_06980 [Prevotella sp.]|nr:hypothetical protein [Prevotella sp.]